MQILYCIVLYCTLFLSLSTVCDRKLSSLLSRSFCSFSLLISFLSSSRSCSNSATCSCATNIHVRQKYDNRHAHRSLDWQGLTCSKLFTARDKRKRETMSTPSDDINMQPSTLLSLKFHITSFKHGVAINGKPSTKSLLLATLKARTQRTK